MPIYVETEPVVETTLGKVRGKLRTAVYGDQYYCFDGIPYGQPPVGELRFKSPQPAQPWQGVRDCTEVAQKSLQYNRYTKQIEGAEDCLYLNVYVTRLVSDKPFPVMVYLHGGGFNTGDATRLSWGPDYFMMQDVVFITIGYRLGVLGFLSLSDLELQVPGNAGLKDIVLALKWIRDNCQRFNGDPANITLFGHSSGGGATHALLLSEQGKELFHKVILMAGFCVELPEKPHLEYRLASHLGYDGPNNDRQVFEYLSAVDSNKLVGFNFWTKEEKDKGYTYAFMPTIESYETPDGILTKPILELQNSPWSKNIPIMLGITSSEALLIYKEFVDGSTALEARRKHPEYWLPSNLQSHCNLGTQRMLAKSAIQLHFGDKKVCKENIDCILDLASHSFIVHTVYRLLHSRLAHSSAPTFLYRFDFDSPDFNLYRIKHCGPKVRGVGHVDELSYIFFMPTSFHLDRKSEEFQTIVRMVDMWTAFAAKSDPNVPSIAPTRWLPVSRFGPRKCLNISNKISFIEFPETQKCKVWDHFYELAGMKLY